MNATIDRVDRTLIGLLGLLALAAGTVGLCLSYGVFGDADSHRSLLTVATRNYTHRSGGWLWPVAALLAALLALLGTWWLLEQASTTRLRRYRLAGIRPDDEITVHGAALVSAVCGEIEGFHGVRSATGSLEGGLRNPRMRLVINVDDPAALAAVRRRVEDESLARARQAAGPDRLPVKLQFNVSARSGTSGRVQ